MWGVYNHLNGTYIQSHSFTDASLTYRRLARMVGCIMGRNLADTFTYALVNGNAIPVPAPEVPNRPGHTACGSPSICDF